MHVAGRDIRLEKAVPPVNWQREEARDCDRCGVCVAANEASARRRTLCHFCCFPVVRAQEVVVVIYVPEWRVLLVFLTPHFGNNAVPHKEANCPISAMSIIVKSDDITP